MQALFDLETPAISGQAAWNPRFGLAMPPEFRAGHMRRGLEPLRAAWTHLAEVRADFPHADAVGAFTVFNIGGNKYRLISLIKYRWQIVYVRHILTLAEYDRGKWKL